MASAIITIAHNLGLEVIAEGVETESQLKILSAMQCEICQGYLLGKPMAEEDMSKLLLQLAPAKPKSQGSESA